MGIIHVKASHRARAYTRNTDSMVVKYRYHKDKAAQNFDRMFKTGVPLRKSRAKNLINAHLHHAKRYFDDIERKYRRGGNGKLFSNSRLYRKLRN